MQLEAIKLERQKVFNRLKKFDDFVLVGGTALALQMGHRISVDFDLFSEKPLPKYLERKIKSVFQGFRVDRTVKLQEHLAFSVDGTKIDFVGDSFPFVLDLIEFHGLKIAQILEIAAMKAYALSFRGALKDYIDLFFILKRNLLSLADIERVGDQKYGGEFNFKLFLQQLVWLEDLRIRDINFLHEGTTKEEMQKFFEEVIKKYKL